MWGFGALLATQEGTHNGGQWFPRGAKADGGTCHISIGSGELPMDEIRNQLKQGFGIGFDVVVGTVDQLLAGIAPQRDNRRRTMLPELVYQLLLVGIRKRVPQHENVEVTFFAKLQARCKSDRRNHFIAFT